MPDSVTPVEVLAAHQAVEYVGDGVWWCRCGTAYSAQHQLDMLGEAGWGLVPTQHLLNQADRLEEESGRWYNLLTRRCWPLWSQARLLRAIAEDAS